MARTTLLFLQRCYSGGITGEFSPTIRRRKFKLALPPEWRFLCTTPSLRPMNPTSLGCNS